MAPRTRHTLVARLDSAGDVLLAGPAVRAVAASSRVTFLCGRRGRAAADLLPGVAEVIEWTSPWVDPEPQPVDPDDIDALRKTLTDLQLDDALILTSFHQSPLPLALLLRLAGVPRIAAISEDYPGTLLDVRHPAVPGVPEAVRLLSVAEAAGYRLPEGDDGRLAVRHPLPDVTHLVGGKPYVVVHPGTSVPARAWAPAHHARLVQLLHGEGFRVIVTGSDSEAALTAAVADAFALDLGGRTTFAELAAVLAGAQTAVVGNTGPAHLAAAVGTPVVSLFAPTVPAGQWAPYGTPTIVLGNQNAPCKDSRALVCPVPGHPCLNDVTPAEVLQAVCGLLRASA